MAIWQSGITKYLLLIWLCRIAKCSLAILQEPIAEHMLAILTTSYHLNGNDFIGLGGVNNVFSHVSLILFATFVF